MLLDLPNLQDFSDLDLPNLQDFQSLLDLLELLVFWNFQTFNTLQNGIAQLNDYRNILPHQPFWKILVNLTLYIYIYFQSMRPKLVTTDNGYGLMMIGNTFLIQMLVSMEIMRMILRGLVRISYLHSVAKVYAVFPFYDVKFLCSGGREESHSHQHFNI